MCYEYNLLQIVGIFLIISYFDGTKNVLCNEDIEPKSRPGNPCLPSPCGRNSDCRVVSENAVCSCRAGFVGTPPSCRPECTRDSHCPSNFACINRKCLDPCSGVCGANTLCSVINHSPVCTCIIRFTGDPFSGCVPVSDVTLSPAPTSSDDEVVKIIDECGNWDEHSPAPWIVTIYRKINNKGEISYQPWCDGSIVTPTVIITVAQCFVTLRGKGLLEPTKNYVVVGKQNTNVLEETFAKFNSIQVINYHMPPTYNFTNFTGNLAIVVLQKPLQLTNEVQPVCFDRNNKIEEWNVDQYQYGTEIQNLNQCVSKGIIDYANQHGFEGRLATGSQFVSQNVGGGINVNNKQQFFIRGIIGLSPTIKREGCDPDLNYGIFINISNYHEFILQILNDHEIKIGDCPDLLIDNGKFELLGQKVSYKLGTPLRNYAIIKFTCDTNYALHPINPTTTCLDGSFTNPIPQCKRILKGAIDDVINVIDECGYWDENPPAPWNVGIYHKEGNNYKFRCVGSIITSTVIITAARCIIINKSDLETNIPAEEFYVAAGKYYNDYNSEEDGFAQKSQVKEYHLTAEFKEKNWDHIGNVAVIVIKNQFHMTNVVQPVCMDRNNKIERRQITPNNHGIVIGWNRINENIEKELQQLNTTYMDNQQCSLELYQYRHMSDQFCARNIGCRCMGAGIAYKWYTNNKQQYYIRGVNTLVDRGIGLFTNITLNKEFILKIIDQQLRTGSCPSITIENGQFSVLGQDSTPNDSVPNYNLVKITCNANYTLYPASPLIACNDGDWNVPIPQCKLTCPPAISSSADVRCSVDGNAVDCTQPLVEGAVARSKCKPFYVKSGYDVPISTCVKGFWSNPLVKCDPECGEVISSGVTHVVKGTSVKQGEFPWHIALYHLVGEKHEYQCGGSIINPLIIITAAHCFRDERVLGLPAEEYYVAAGKYYSDYKSAEDKFVQKRQVKEYHIPSEYTGYESSYAADLAVVVVRKAFEMTNVVQPVCTDWDGTMESEQLKHNNIGSVVGWGYVDPNIPKASAELKQLNPPFIDRDQCLKDVPSSFRRWVTLDKFCAGYLNGSSICKGDSGGGLVFKWNNYRDKYFLRGLVSVGPIRKGVCDDFQYGVYTRISYYHDFILNIIVANLIKD